MTMLTLNITVRLVLANSGEIASRSIATRK